MSSLTSSSPPLRPLSGVPAPHPALRPRSLQPLPAQLLSSLCPLSSRRQMWPQTWAAPDQLTGRGEQLHQAGSWPWGPTGTPSSPTVMGTLSGGLRGPGAELGRGPPPRSLRWWGCWLGPSLPFICPQVLWPTYALSHWDKSPSLNSSQTVPPSKAGPPATPPRPPPQHSSSLWLLRSLPRQAFFPQLTHVNRLPRLKNKLSNDAGPFSSLSSLPWSPSLWHPQLCTP